MTVREKSRIAAEAADTLHTIIDMIRWAVSQFNPRNLSYGHGTENSWDEAVNLILSSLNLPPEVDRAVMHARLTPTEKALLVSRIERRALERIPVAYLVQEAWFAGLPFYVDERVIIPRSPIAELIAGGLRPWVDMEGVHRLLDLCTGSGCIAISCAMHFPHVQIDAVDISEDALAVAHINRERHQADVRFVQSDLFANLGDTRYDVIISNPPYVDAAEMAGLPPEYRCEPTLALASGEDGLEIVRRILLEARNHLTPQGVLIVEVGCSQAALEAAYPKVPFTWLQFEHGGDGVFLLNAEELNDFVV